MLHAQTSTPPTKHVQFKFFIIPMRRGVESYGHCAQRSYPAYTPKTSQSISRNLPLARARASCFLLCTIKPSLPTGRSAREPLSVHPGLRRPQAHLPPFARSSEPRVDSPPVAGAESEKQKQNRWTAPALSPARILRPAIHPLSPLPVSARSAIPDYRRGRLDPSQTRRRGGRRHPTQTTRAAA